MLLKYKINVLYMVGTASLVMLKFQIVTASEAISRRTIRLAGEIRQAPSNYRAPWIEHDVSCRNLVANYHGTGKPGKLGGLTEWERKIMQEKNQKVEKWMNWCSPILNEMASWFSISEVKLQKDTAEIYQISKRVQGVKALTEHIAHKISQQEIIYGDQRYENQQRQVFSNQVFILLHEVSKLDQDVNKSFEAKNQLKSNKDISSIVRWKDLMMKLLVGLKQYDSSSRKTLVVFLNEANQGALVLDAIMKKLPTSNDFIENYLKFDLKFGLKQIFKKDDLEILWNCLDENTQKIVEFEYLKSNFKKFQENNNSEIDMNQPLKNLLEEVLVFNIRSRNSDKQVPLLFEKLVKYIASPSFYDTKDKILTDSKMVEMKLIYDSLRFVLKNSQFSLGFYLKNNPKDIYILNQMKALEDTVVLNSSTLRWAWLKFGPVLNQHTNIKSRSILASWKEKIQHFDLEKLNTDKYTKIIPNHHITNQEQKSQNLQDILNFGVFNRKMLNDLPIKIRKVEIEKISYAFQESFQLFEEYLEQSKVLKSEKQHDPKFLNLLQFSINTTFEKIGKIQADFNLALFKN